MGTFEQEPGTTTATRRSSASEGGSPQSRRALGQAAAFGLALFGVSLASFTPESTPDPGTATAAEIRRFAAANATTIRLNTLAALASVALLVTFVAALAKQIRAMRPDSIGPNVMVSLAAVVAAQMLFLAAASSVFGRPEELADVSDGAIVSFYQLLAIAEWLYTLTVLLPCAVLVATYSWLALGCRLIARWVSFFGFALTIAATVTTILLFTPFTRLDTLVVPLFGWWLWPLTISSAAGVRWWRSRSRSASPRGKRVRSRNQRPEGDPRPSNS